jgi:Holliday junction resolvase RusA-like endonuclease
MPEKKKVTELKVIAPFAVYLPRKTVKDKRIPVNLNWLRNAQYFEVNQVKKLYKELVRGQFDNLLLETPITVSYQVFKPTKRRLDKQNVTSITAKFLLDALTECGVIPDDNDDYIKDEWIKPTVHDKGNERVEVLFKSVSKTTRGD